MLPLELIPIDERLESDGTVLLSNAEDRPVDRIKTGPWDKCWGDGMAVSGTTLLSGEPGAGKSTIACQISGSVLSNYPKEEILYVAAEESITEIRPRIKRLGFDQYSDRFRCIPMGSPAKLSQVLQSRKPKLVVLDSLQGFTDDLQEQSEILKALKPLAVQNKCPIIAVSQINKSGEAAGWMSHQHDVDTLIEFTIHNDLNDLRELYTRKNRHAVNAASVRMYFEMSEKGLILVSDPFEDESED